MLQQHLMQLITLQAHHSMESRADPAQAAQHPADVKSAEDTVLAQAAAIKVSTRSPEMHRVLTEGAAPA